MKYFFFKTLLATGAIAAIIAFIKGMPKNTLTFDGYKERCIDAAKEAVEHGTPFSKAIVVLSVSNESKVIAFLYRRYEDGTIRKMQLPNPDFPLENCPVEVQDKIKTGEYLIYTF